MKTGLYNGRFQPFHLGHLSAIKQALKEVDQLLIGIGSSQYSHETDNPFTGEERKAIIESVLKDEGLDSRCMVFLIPDIHDDDKWCAHVRTIVPKFDVVFVGNEGLVKELFEKEDRSRVRVVKHELDISATKIRDAVRNGDNWKALLPESVVAYLEVHDGMRRIRES